MTRSRRCTGMMGLLLTAWLWGCATASSPWAEHEARAGAKAATLDPTTVCPVVLHNGTPVTVDASYEVVGMRFDLGLLPSGQSAEFEVQCRTEQVQATAVSHSVAMDEPQRRFQKRARLDLASVTRLHLTQADLIH